MRPLLVFDNDGTLHETLRIYEPAARAGIDRLKESGHPEISQPALSQIQSWIGMNMHEMWADFYPTLPEEEKQSIARFIGQHMIRELDEGGGGWFDGVEEMLTLLKEAGFAMAILSNCGVDYAEAHWRRFQMERFFVAFFTCETYNEAPKSEILCEIARDPEAAILKEPVHNPAAEAAPEKLALFGMAGDRASDLAAAAAAEVPFFGCLYGYGNGELEAKQESYDKIHLAKRPQEIAEAAIRICDAG